MQSLKAISLVLALGASSFVNAILDKPAMRANLDAFNAGLTSHLDSPKYTFKQWNAGTISQVCKERSQAEGFDPSSMITYEVTYADCSYPWLLCRHVDANTTVSTFIENIGRVPTHMRQFMATTILFPAPYAHAYASGVNLVFFGAVDTVAIYIHEATHAMEFSDAFNASKLLGDQPAWTDAYNQDQAVPDEYARTNQRENIAQFSGLVLYDSLVAGGIKSVDSNVTKIQNQLDEIRWQATNVHPLQHPVQLESEVSSNRWGVTYAISGKQLGPRGYSF